MSIRPESHRSNQIEIELVLKVKRQLVIDLDTTVAESKRIVKDVFKQFGRDFILMAGENDLTSLDKLGLVKTLDYYETNVITVLPLNNQNDDKFIDSGMSENFRSCVDNSRSQGMYGQQCLMTDEYDLKFKENEFYRRSINTACVDLDDLKNHLMSIHITNEDDNLGKASVLLKKTDNIIEETNQFLKNYYNMSKGLSYEAQKNIDFKASTHAVKSERNLVNYNNLKGAIYDYDTYTPNRKQKNIVLPCSDRKTASKIPFTAGYRSTKADTDKISIINDYEAHSNNKPIHASNKNNSNKGSRENSKSKLGKSPIRNDTQRSNRIEDQNLNKLKSVVKKTEICLLKEENDYLKETVDVLTNNLNGLQFKINELENDLISAQEKEINQLKINLESLNEKLKGSDKEIVEFKLIIQKLEKSNISVKADRKNLLDNISQQEKEIKILTNLMQNLEQDNKKLFAEKETLDSIKEDLKKVIDDLNNNNALNVSLLKENENYKNQLAKLNRIINEKNSEIEKLLDENFILKEKHSENKTKIKEYLNDVKKSNEDNMSLKTENSKLKENLLSIKSRIFDIHPNETQFFSIFRDPRFDLRPIINKLKYELEEIQKEKEIMSIICENSKSKSDYRKNSLKKSETTNFELISNTRSNHLLEIEELIGQRDKLSKLLEKTIAEPNKEYNRLSSKFIPKIRSTYFASKVGKCSSHPQQNVLSSNKHSSEIHNSPIFAKKKVEVMSNKNDHLNLVQNNVTNLNLSAIEIDKKKSKDNSKKPIKINDYSGEDNSDFIEISADLLNSVELNTLARHQENSKLIEVNEGALHLFRVYDRKSILKFDIENRHFKIVEFADFCNFEENFAPQGSIYLNTINGLFIVTGKSHDMFYFFNNKTNSMVKLSKLNDNHTFGSLVYYERRNMLICLSGWHNKKVEIYHNDEIISGFFKNKTNIVSDENKMNIPKCVWSYLPEMKIERSECPYLIINETLLYSFFGYNCLTDSYVENIEFLNLESPLYWQEIKIKNNNRLSTMIKSHTVVPMKNTLLFFGGYDGLNDEPIEDFFELNLDEMVISGIDRKYRDIKKNHFYNFQQDSSMIPYKDHKDRMHFACFDGNDRVHAYDLETLNYDIFYFE